MTVNKARDETTCLEIIENKFKRALTLKIYQKQTGQRPNLRACFQYSSMQLFIISPPSTGS